MGFRDDVEVRIGGDESDLLQSTRRGRGAISAFARDSERMGRTMVRVGGLVTSALGGIAVAAGAAGVAMAASVKGVAQLGDEARRSGLGPVAPVPRSSRQDPT